LPHDVDESCCQAHAWGHSPEEEETQVMFDLAVVCLITPKTGGSGQSNQITTVRVNLEVMLATWPRDPSNDEGSGKPERALLKSWIPERVHNITNSTPIQ
jgi:hypothetical protein